MTAGCSASAVSRTEAPISSEFASALMRVKPRHPVHVDQDRRRHDAAADIDHQIGAAAERLAVRMSGARGQRLVERGRD